MKIALYSPVLPTELWRRQYAVSILKGFLAVGWQVDVLGGSDVAPSDFDNLGTFVSVDVPKADGFAPPSLKRLRQVSELGQELSQDYDLFISLESPVPLFNHAKCGAWIPPFPSAFKPQAVTGATGFFSKLKQNWYNRLEWNSRFTKYLNIFVPSKYMQKLFYERYRLWSTVLPPEIVAPCETVKPEEKSNAVCLLTDSEETKNVLSKQFDMLVKNAGIETTLTFVYSSDPFESVIAAINASALFWDATGFNTNDPDRVGAFPFYSAYAMALGTVPITFCAGAAPETVLHQQSGVIWQTVPEALSAILGFSKDNALRLDFAALAQTRAQYFSTELFQKRLISSLKR
ncbi:MAG: hypothetical protein IJQ39_11645 [Thermoguttaceae bacterium]|nr:hypothetical protein [Thermoguttaceae bacterium]